MDLENPFNEIWCNLNESFEEESIYDPNIILSRWCDVREDFDDFNHSYYHIKNKIQKVIENNGSFEYDE